MPKVIGGLLALIALATSTVTGADAFTTLTRGAIAYFVGMFLASLWYVFFTIRVARPVASEDIEETPVGQG
jgi:hypothetical protein